MLIDHSVWPAPASGTCYQEHWEKLSLMKCLRNYLRLTYLAFILTDKLSADTDFPNNDCMLNFY